MRLVYKTFSLLLLALIFISCNGQTQQETFIDVPKDVNKTVERPTFSSDSAFGFIEYQVELGPRVPGSEAHQECASWLAETLERLGAEVQTQTTTLMTAEQKSVPCYNVIGSYNPESKQRILLAAHWDTRPWADQDEIDTDQPILGANDGASGVGVLLEVARQIQNKSLDIGIDIIFFDVEDSGLPQVRDSYCLGSQYWGKNPHIKDYYAQNGILLDMVGAQHATFGLEENSRKINSSLQQEVWELAHQLGHGRYFVYRNTPAIIDDHYYVYKHRQIPMIDIIQHDATTLTGFGDYWHTHADNLDVIDKNTLQAVGETVLATILRK